MKLMQIQMKSAIESERAPSEETSCSGCMEGRPHLWTTFCRPTKKNVNAAKWKKVQTTKNSKTQVPLSTSENSPEIEYTGKESKSLEPREIKKVSNKEQNLSLQIKKLCQEEGYCISCMEGLPHKRTTYCKKPSKMSNSANNKKLQETTKKSTNGVPHFTSKNSPKVESTGKESKSLESRDIKGVSNKFQDRSLQMKSKTLPPEKTYCTSCMEGLPLPHRSAYCKKTSKNSNAANYKKLQETTKKSTTGVPLSTSKNSSTLNSKENNTFTGKESTVLESREITKISNKVQGLSLSQKKHIKEMNKKPDIVVQPIEEILNAYEKSVKSFIKKNGVSRDEADAAFKKTSKNILENAEIHPKPVVAEAINFMAFVFPDLKERKKSSNVPQDISRTPQEIRYPAPTIKTKPLKPKIPLKEIQNSPEQLINRLDYDSPDPGRLSVVRPEKAMIYGQNPTKNQKTANQKEISLEKISKNAADVLDQKYYLDMFKKASKDIPQMPLGTTSLTHSNLSVNEGSEARTKPTKSQRRRNRGKNAKNNVENIHPNDLTKTQISPLKKKVLKEHHIEIKKGDFSNCPCAFPQIHQNPIGEKEFFPKLRTIKIKRKNDEKGGPCEQYSLLHNFMYNEKWNLNGERTEYKDVRAKNILCLIYNLFIENGVRKNGKLLQKMVQTLIDGRISLDAFYIFLIKEKPILKQNVALPLWSVLRECLPGLQRGLILKTICMKEMGILPPCDLQLIKLLQPELNEVPNHCLRN
jgi:hypothetical protein